MARGGRATWRFLRSCCLLCLLWGEESEQRREEGEEGGGGGRGRGEGGDGPWARFAVLGCGGGRCGGGAHCDEGMVVGREREVRKPVAARTNPGRGPNARRPARVATAPATSSPFPSLALVFLSFSQNATALCTTPALGLVHLSFFIAMPILLHRVSHHTTALLGPAARVLQPENTRPLVGRRDRSRGQCEPAHTPHHSLISIYLPSAERHSGVPFPSAGGGALRSRQIDRSPSRVWNFHADTPCPPPMSSSSSVTEQASSTDRTENIVWSD